MDNEVEICLQQKHCETCPLFERCYDISNEVEDDYETMEPEEFLEKYL